MLICPCFILCLLAVLIALPLWAAESPPRSAASLLPQLARAWLADNAQTSIDIQYFIWSSDNIGILRKPGLSRESRAVSCNW
jgi:hypothetical protein